MRWRPIIRAWATAKTCSHPNSQPYTQLSPSLSQVLDLENVMHHHNYKWIGMYLLENISFQSHNLPHCLIFTQSTASYMKQKTIHCRSKLPQIFKKMKVGMLCGLPLRVTLQCWNTLLRKMKNNHLKYTQFATEAMMWYKTLYQNMLHNLKTCKFS